MKKLTEEARDRIYEFLMKHQSPYSIFEIQFDENQNHVSFNVFPKIEEDDGWTFSPITIDNQYNTVELSEYDREDFKDYTHIEFQIISQ